MHEARDFFTSVKARLVWDRELWQELHIECFEAERAGDYAYAEVLRNLLQPDTSQNP